MGPGIQNAGQVGQASTHKEDLWPMVGLSFGPKVYRGVFFLLLQLSQFMGNLPSGFYKLFEQKDLKYLQLHELCFSSQKNSWVSSQMKLSDTTLPC